MRAGTRRVREAGESTTPRPQGPHLPQQVVAHQSPLPTKPLPFPPNKINNIADMTSFPTGPHWEHKPGNLVSQAVLLPPPNGWSFRVPCLRSAPSPLLPLHTHLQLGLWMLQLAPLSLHHCQHHAQRAQRPPSQERRPFAVSRFPPQNRSSQRYGTWCVADPPTHNSTYIETMSDSFV